jgi:integrase
LGGGGRLGPSIARAVHSPGRWNNGRGIERLLSLGLMPQRHAETAAAPHRCDWMIEARRTKKSPAGAGQVVQREAIAGRRSTSPRRFKLVSNPAGGIPTEPKVVGTRWLDEEEFVQLYRWLECPDAPVHPPYTRAVRILMLTGQRVEEIAALHIDQWDAAERIIDWSKTKNGKPHAIPVPALAAELIESIMPNKFGWFFPSAKDPSRPVSATTLYSFMWRQRDRGVIPLVTNRDLRRTWKTLAGKAGVSKEIRDRLQNHTLQDVSSKSYDRWNYMPEKRAGMEKWDAFVTALLREEPFKSAPLAVAAF